ncbi:hypothetical protein SS50377_21959 [Spironucleus salmonicida]|uniref:Uncharacterized protein n=1 Tax=Spironucleus salmonicida TaxID=348837 RepID=V6LRW0_9EUKA|nr:hypothetical protein SS50377_21959 [Spironucleus salmonicida]|eukprot:EST46998.1 Hypothetical protein SS50377_12952 [Spironucleus salmonicida]
MRSLIIPPNTIFYEFESPVFITMTRPEILIPQVSIKILNIPSLTESLEIQFFPHNLSFFQLLLLPDSAPKMALLAVNSAEQRKFIQAKQMAQGNKQLLLIISYLADYNSKSQQAVECLFSLLDKTDDIFRDYPQDNAFFDIETVICKEFDSFRNVLVQLRKGESFVESYLHCAILYFVDLMLVVNIQKTLGVSQDMLEVLQQYTMNKRYIYDSQIQQKMTVIYQTLSCVISGLTLKIQLELLLELSSFPNTDFGFAYYYFQSLLCSISGSQQAQYNINSGNAQKLINSLNQKFLQNYHKIAGSQDAFQQQINLTQALAMTYNHLNDVNETKRFIQIISNSLLSENEFHNVTIKNLEESLDIFEIFHFNQFFLHDVHLVLIILYEFVSVLNQQTLQTVQKDIDLFIYKLVYNVNFRGFTFIKNKEEFSQGMTYTQIFQISNEIFQFCVTYSKYNHHEILLFNLREMGCFSKEYGFNELGLTQQLQLWKYIFEINTIDSTYIHKYVEYALQIVKNSIQWVKTQLYSEFFELVSILMWFLVVENDVQQIITHIQNVQIKEVILNFIIKLLQFGVQTNQFIDNFAYISCKLDLLSDFQQFFLLNTKLFDPQYVCQFVFSYINNQSKNQGTDKCKYQNLVITIIRHYHAISYNQQNYIYLAQLSAGLIFFDLSFANQDCTQIFQEIESIFVDQCIPDKYYKEILNQFIDSEIWNKANQNNSIQEVLQTILGKCQKLEIQTQIQLIINKIQQDLEISIDVISQNSTPYQSGILEKVQFQFCDFPNLPKFPHYNEIDKLIKYVKIPGIPFAFIIPHPLAKSSTIQTDLDSLIRDIGTIETLHEVVNDFLIPEQRPQSGNAPKQVNSSARPMSAGGLKVVQETVQKVQVQRKKKESGVEQLQEWSGSGSDEENLLEMLDNEGIL